jgi:hypothetical protein
VKDVNQFVMMMKKGIVISSLRVRIRVRATRKYRVTAKYKYRAS